MTWANADPQEGAAPATALQRVAAEALGTLLLLAVVVGSGIMGDAWPAEVSAARPARREEYQSALMPALLIAALARA